MAKKRTAFVSPKLVNPVVIGASKKSSKNAAGGGNSFKQGKLDNKFKNVNPTSAGGVTNAKPPKGNVVSEASMNRPTIGFGKGFKGAPVVGRPVVTEKKKWGQEALKKADKPPSEGGTKGSLRKMLGKKKGEKISRSELKSIIDSPTASTKKKQKALAIYNLGGGKKK